MPNNKGYTKPKSEMLGTGAASKAAKAIEQRKSKQKAKLDEIMGKMPKSNNYK